MFNSNKKSTHSHHPLPSLCSSISSHNSSTKSISIDSTSSNRKKRWDESQLAIELCDNYNNNTHHCKLNNKFTAFIRKIKSTVVK